MTGTAVDTQETNGLALGAFIISLLGLALPALVMGIVALRQCRRRGQRGDGFALAAIWIGAIGTAFWSFFIFALALAAGA